MYTRLAELSQEHSRVSKRSNSTPTQSFFLRKQKKSCQGPKETKYTRDILCLPGSWCTRPRIPVPRRDRQSYITENGLLGKIEFSSVMLSKDIILKVSRVFASQVGLSTSEIEDKGKRFNFLFCNGLVQGPVHYVSLLLLNYLNYNGTENMWHVRQNLEA